ncbi:unnamed protein product [Acanthoscelides obtectus]|uniref:Uncharacterized protein n=1 Tax=Acanthoscelides obtectus TaxID=200917 RepID=A0A9P0LAC6_ACAOB|nr:unnamed protein product [Acanthoscelides obtectus]CAK1626561.1 NF-kappa-B inhibitor cactus [Acanthoscelides obtectus]
MFVTIWKCLEKYDRLYVSKQKFDDKGSLYESSNTDSGFLSGEITEESPDSVADPMIVTSGVCLTEDFSKISISDEKQSLNNLDAPKQKPPVARSKQTVDEVLWKIYFEQDEDGDTYLHMAIADGFPEVALALIRIAPHPRLLDTPNDFAQTPLHLAVETGQWRIARWLRVAGARPCPRDKHGDSPLHLAARMDDAASIRALTEAVTKEEREMLALGYDIPAYQPCCYDQWNYLGQTCLHVAVAQESLTSARLLLERGCNPNARDGFSGMSPLHYAAHLQKPIMAELLLKGGANREAESYAGLSALEEAARAGQLSQEVKRVLLAAGVPLEIAQSDDDEEMDEDDDDVADQLAFDSNKVFNAPLVNASA